MAAFANIPEPPYYAVIFTSQRAAEDKGYSETAERMAALAAQQPGYLGSESARTPGGFGITVSYWTSEEAIAAGKPTSSIWSRRNEARPSGMSTTKSKWPR